MQARGLVILAIFSKQETQVLKLPTTARIKGGCAGRDEAGNCISIDPESSGFVCSSRWMDPLASSVTVLSVDIDMISRGQFL